MVYLFPLCNKGLGHVTPTGTPGKTQLKPSRRTWGGLLIPKKPPVGFDPCHIQEAYMNTISSPSRRCGPCYKRPTTFIRTQQSLRRNMLIFKGICFSFHAVTWWSSKNRIQQSSDIWQVINWRPRTVLGSPEHFPRPPRSWRQIPERLGLRDQKKGQSAALCNTSLRHKIGLYSSCLKGL